MGWESGRHSFVSYRLNVRVQVNIEPETTRTHDGHPSSKWASPTLLSPGTCLSFLLFFNFIFVVRVCSSVFILHPSCPRSNRTRQVNHNKRWHRRGPSLAIFRSAFRQSLDANSMMDSTAVPTTTLYSLQFSYSFVYETRRFAGLGELMRLTY